MGWIQDLLLSGDKWRFKFKGIVSHNGEIRADMMARFGFGDSADSYPFSESELYKRYRDADTTDSGRRELRRAFDAVRTAKLQQGLSLEVADPHL